MTKPQTRLAPSVPFPGLEKAPKVMKRFKPQINLSSLEFCDDPIPDARKSIQSKYEATFRHALEHGKTVKCESESASAICNAARKWCQVNRIKDVLVRSTSDYGDGFGRVWIVKATPGLKKVA